jgi:enterobactin synthetase component D
VAIPGPYHGLDLSEYEVRLPAVLEKAAPKRRLEFLAGRLCADLAVKRLVGARAGSIGRDSDGCPLWPEGLVGSISHSDCLATAAVAPKRETNGLGVDTEPVMSEEAARDVVELIAREDEVARTMQTAELSWRQTVTLIHSAKESLFKSLYPLRRTRFFHLDCELVWIDSQTRRFAMRFRSAKLDSFGAGEYSGGRFEFADGCVHTGIVLPANGPRTR